MLGLALMAAELAEKRAGYGPASEWGSDEEMNLGRFMEARANLSLYSRDEVQFSRAYYRICDRIAQGKKP